MNRKQAIKYLMSKEKIKFEKFSEKEENLIKEVMKEGKIFGDPLVKLNG